jgi:DNA modification methylase
VCVEGCPVKALSEQSGECRSSGHINTSESQTPPDKSVAFGQKSRDKAIPGVNTYSDKGTAARFFKTFSREDDLLEPVETSVDARVLRGDCLERLKELPDDSIDACVTDPPYGLSKEPDIAEVMKHWLEGNDYLHNSKGFMGTSWDSFCPGPRYWKEIYRVMKPGAHLLCFSGTRTWDLMSMAIRFAGFENRDTIRHDSGPPALGWLYGSGFPKSLDVAKQIDKMAGAEREVLGVNTNGVGKKSVAYDAGNDTPRKSTEFAPEYDITTPATEEAKQWSGWGTAMKPAWECILCFRKPLSESSVARQVLKTSTGAINIEQSRVAGKRWPANLLLSHCPPDENGEGGCKRVGEGKVKGINGGDQTKGPYTSETTWSTSSTGPSKRRGYADPEGFETITKYECEDSCPIRALDEQSGVSKDRPAKYAVNGKGVGRSGSNGPVYNGVGGSAAVGYETQGGASRFFQSFPPAGFKYAAKASRRERQAGLEDMPPRIKTDVDPDTGEEFEYEEKIGNVHPCVKPIALMSYLVKLICPPGGVVLDPFAGSGSTLCAAVSEGFDAIGIEMSDEYADIAERRIAYWSQPEEARAKQKSTPKARNTYGFKTTDVLRRCPEHNESIPSGSTLYKCGCEKVWYKVEPETPRNSLF